MDTERDQYEKWLDNLWVKIDVLEAENEEKDIFGITGVSEQEATIERL